MRIIFDESFPGDITVSCAEGEYWLWPRADRTLLQFLGPKDWTVLHEAAGFRRLATVKEVEKYLDSIDFDLIRLEMRL